MLYKVIFNACQLDIEYTEGYYYILLGYVVIDVVLIQARTFKKK